MALIKTIADIQKYLKLNSSNKLDSILPFVNDATEKYIKYWIGKELLEALEEFAAETSPSESDPLALLLPMVQNPLAKFTLFLAAPSMDLQISEAGFVVSNTTALAPASKDRVERLITSFENLGYDALNDLLKFLEENKADYEEWESSDGYTIMQGQFIKTADEFDKYVNINRSRLKFHGFRQSMRNVEMLQVVPAITQAQIDAIKAEIEAGDISEEFGKVIPLIAASIANYTAAEEGMGEKYNALGEKYLLEVKKIMDANPDDYPDYADSNQYIASRENYKAYENKLENKNFVFGG